MSGSHDLGFIALRVGSGLQKLKHGCRLIHIGFPFVGVAGFGDGHVSTSWPHFLQSRMKTMGS